MIKFLENLLFEKTKDTQSDILFAQWNYDKKVIPAALNAVSSLFPHYSLHDETHSITIINNIVRILGKESIGKLSSIDIWLILEASYSHDIGMVVTSEELVESLSSPDFILFFEELINDESSGLHEFASQFKIEDKQIQYKGTHLNLELHDGIKFILAEYFRRKHSQRSQEIIASPLKKLSLSSPRGVIPDRIFRILGDICASHTKSFEEVLELPITEVGIDIEDAHPRFVACLLRIGDLLDLDNNRFSEVMLRTLTKIPVDTLNHKSKHLSIESFRVDREKIEVVAKCKDYDTANITQHWFNYLDSEISKQMINWNDIVPSKDLGYLPTIGNLKVELENYEFIDGKNKPKFRVDTDKALGLLQGAGIYDGAYQCIREILQNAVDATLIRIWEEHHREKDFTKPQTSDVLEVVSNYPIKVIIEEKGVESDNKKIHIEIIDNGTGISTNDLKYLMKTGSSSKNRDRRKIIDEMPKWMQPSGVFGIGFQSVFMLANVVFIETKSYFDEQFQKIQLNSPNSPKEGDILIEKQETNHSVKPHTKISLTHSTEAIPNRYTIKGQQEITSRIAHSFDPFSHESMDIELGKVLDEVFAFAFRSYIPIELIHGEENIPTGWELKNQFDYFDEENSLELKFRFYNNSQGRRTLTTYYKNQQVNNDLSLKYLGIDCNVHKDKASKVLTLNRNKIRPEYRDTLINDILQSSFKTIIKNFDSIFNDDEKKERGSMFLNFYSKEGSVSNYDISSFNHWERIKLKLGESGENEMQFKELLNSIERIRIIYDNPLNSSESDVFELNDKELVIKFRGSSPKQDVTDFFLFKASEMFTSIERSGVGVRGFKEVLYTKGKYASPISEETLKMVLKNLKDGFSTARRFIPCLKDFVPLRLKDDAHMPYVFTYDFDNINYVKYPKMLSPFIAEYKEDRNYKLKVVLNEKVYDWVYENRYNEKTTKEEIIETYREFVEAYDVDELNRL